MLSVVVFLLFLYVPEVLLFLYVPEALLPAMPFRQLQASTKVAITPM